MSHPSGDIVSKCFSCEEIFYYTDDYFQNNCEVSHIDGIIGSGDPRRSNGLFQYSESGARPQESPSCVQGAIMPSLTAASAFRNFSSPPCLRMRETAGTDTVSSMITHSGKDNTNLSTISASNIGVLPDASVSFQKSSTVNAKNNDEVGKHKKGKRGAVWTFFNALDEKKAMCCVCQKILSYCGTPTNLSYHLHRYHPEEDDIVKSKQTNKKKYHYLSNKLPKPLLAQRKKREIVNVVPSVPVEKTVVKKSILQKKTTLFVKDDKKQIINNILSLPVEKSALQSVLPQATSSITVKKEGQIIDALRPYATLPILPKPAPSFIINKMKRKLVTPVEKNVMENDVPLTILPKKLMSFIIDDKKEQIINTMPTLSVPFEKNVIEKSITQTILPNKTASFITDETVEMVLSDMLPLDVVENTHFKEINDFEPNCKVPPAKKFYSDHILKMYNIESNKLLKVLNDAESLNVSVELWTGFEDMTYMTISIHFITSDFCYKNCVINTLSVTNSDPEHLMKEITCSVSRWSPSLNVMYLVTDESEILTKASEKATWKHIRCLSCLINNIFQPLYSVSNELMAVIEKCRYIVSLFRNNDTAKQKLSDIAKEKGSDTAINGENPMEMIEDRPMEWMSTYYMMKRIYTLKPVIVQILSHFPPDIRVVPNRFWSVVQESVRFFGYFVDILQMELIDHPYPLLSIIVPVTERINEVVKKSKGKLRIRFFETIREKIESEFDSYYDNVMQNMILSVATLVDLRFKHLPFMSKTAAEAAIQALTAEAEVEAISSSFANLIKSVENDKSSHTSSLWESFDKKAALKRATSKANSTVNEEIENYLKEPPLSRKEDPLLWWQTQGKTRYPILSRIAKRLLSIPATAIPPERVFLEEKRIFGDKRKKIKPKYVDNVIFLNQNTEFSLH